MVNPNYIVGFVDGEGTFAVYGKKSNKHPYPLFAITNTNKMILEEIKTYFKCGNIFVKPKPREHLNWKLGYYYTVKRYDDLKEIIIPFFEKYPPIVKKGEFELMKQCLKDWKVTRRLPRRGNWKDFEKNIIIDYNSGMSWLSIIKKYRISYYTLHIIKKNNNLNRLRNKIINGCHKS